MEASVRKYLATVGRRGGLASRRTLSADIARTMVRVRVARHAYRRFYAQCFWPYAPDLRITAADVLWVAEQLKKHGGRDAWDAGARLCR